MNALTLVINILLTIFQINDGTYAMVCPGSNADNQTIVEDFLTKPYWSSERTETNTQSVTVSEIMLLTDSSDSNVCILFNEIYQEALDEENSPGEKAYNVSYYKAGSFYFVVISIRQPADESYIASGVNYIHIYDLGQVSNSV